ncbi:MAG TPA: hypothetical protein DCZ83_01350 [Candidatus Yonathbacteria bacterium]|nr:hypothetical protein [Candidatus Yonathbacteria bacterium]
MIKKTSKISRPGRGSADPKKGAVLLIAILVSSVALAVGFGVYNRTYKELLFASFWKQTQIAFSAADAGLECALYWELHKEVPNPACFGDDILPAKWVPGEEANFNLDIPGGGCVNIIIAWDSDPLVLATTTSARGYNTCDTTSSRRVERGLGFSL